jgi:hypothetical protein
MIIVFCQVEFSATGRSLVQRNPTVCGVPFCVIQKPQAIGGTGPGWAVAPEKKVLSFLNLFLDIGFSGFTYLSVHLGIIFYWNTTAHFTSIEIYNTELSYHLTVCNLNTRVFCLNTLIGLLKLEDDDRRFL